VEARDLPLLSDPKVVAGSGIVGGEISCAITEVFQSLANQGCLSYLARACKHLNEAASPAEAGDKGTEIVTLYHVDSIIYDGNQESDMPDYSCIII
jgi:hypothetical protein